ncbi:MAG: three-Cys-motif partner protein TcmP [Gemmatimonadaceae bacterium]
MADEFFGAPRDWSRWKHLIVQKYLRIWAYKLGSTSRVLVFVDGCAGAGRYVDGSEGSPLLAAKLNDDPGLAGKTSVIVVAFEHDPDTVERLRLALEPWATRKRPLAYVIPERFDVGLRAIDAAIRGAPTFYFIDPYGMKELTPANLAPVLNGKRAHQELLLRVDANLLARWVGQLKNAATGERQRRLATAFGKRLEACQLDLAEMRELAQAGLDKGVMQDAVLEKYLQVFERRFRFLLLIPIRPTFHAAPKYYLLFGTDSAHGAAHMNDVVGTTEDAIWADSEARKTARTGQGTLFDVPRPHATVREAATALLGALRDGVTSGHWIELRAHLALVFGSEFREKEHRAALQTLIQDGLVLAPTERLSPQTIIRLAT